MFKLVMFMRKNLWYQCILEVQFGVVVAKVWKKRLIAKNRLQTI